MAQFQLGNTVHLLNPDHSQPWGHLSLATVVDTVESGTPPHTYIVGYIAEDEDSNLWQVDNRQMEIVPEVGMGVTEQIGSDRTVYTIIEVKSEKLLVIQADNYKLVDGSIGSEHQEYEYTPNPNGSIVEISRRRNGRWHQVGQDMNSSMFGINVRRAYRDPSF